MSGIQSVIDKIAAQKAQELLTRKANEIADDVKELARASIQEWYDAYSPSSYRRTYSTFAASTRICNIGKTVAVAGVRIMPSNVPDMYKDGVAYVFPRTFSQGIHGTTLTGGVTESPESKLNAKFNAYKSSL